MIHTPNQDSGGTASNINPETPAVESPFLASVNADWVKPPSDLSASIVGAGSGGLVAAKAASSANGQAAAKEIFQSRGRYRWRVQCHGWADRAGYMIPRPSLVTIGGVAAKELHGTFNCACKGSFGGVPVYRAAWSIIYALDSAPTQPIKPNFSPVGTQ